MRALIEPFVRPFRLTDRIQMYRPRIADRQAKGWVYKGRRRSI